MAGAMGKVMSRQFKVGDIVNGFAKDEGSATGQRLVSEKKLINSIDGDFYIVGDYFFIDQYLTLIKAVEDTFTPWIEESLRDSDPLVRAVANDLVIMMER